MQEMTSTICSAATKPLAAATNVTFTKSSSTSLVPRTVLIDNRDNKKYLVSKLADGNCWMSQNLGLDLSTSETLTNTNTDLNSKSSWKPNNNTTTSTAKWGNSFESGDTTDHSYKPTVYTYYRGGTVGAASPTSSDSKYLWESAGNYYNWYTATAGSGTTSITTDNARDSICAKGWTLPDNSSNAKNSFYYLITTIYDISNGSNLLNYPLNFVASGAFDHVNGGSELVVAGSGGVYWSKTAASSHLAYDLDFRVGGSNVVPNYRFYKGRGYSVRCIAK